MQVWKVDVENNNFDEDLWCVHVHVIRERELGRNLHIRNVIVNE